ncbi:MAG: hypothetical protein ABJC39_10690 [Chloroflexota bacterium]
MTRGSRPDETLDRMMAAWFEERAHGDHADAVIDAALARTSRQRPLPTWRLPERWIPDWRGTPFLPDVRLGPVLLIGLLVLLAAALLVVVGSQRHTPPSFGVAVNGLIAYDTFDKIYVANGDGTGVMPLVTGIPNAAAATWSPDGTRLAFWGDDSPDSLYVINADGTGIRKVAGDLWIGTDKPPAWSPDSRSIVFSSESGADRRDEGLYMVDVSAATVVRLGDPTTIPVRALFPAWSPDGAWIAFEGVPTSGAGDPELWIVRPSGLEARKLPTSKLLGDFAGPRWAPTTDRSVIAYAAKTASGGRHDLFLFDVDVDVDAARETVILASPEDKRWPAWSPDATRLAWLVGASPMSLKVASIDDMADQTTFPIAGVGAPPAWSPDGVTVYGSDAGKRTVIVIAVDGTSSPVRIDHPGGQGPPTWQRRAP